MHYKCLSLENVEVQTSMFYVTGTASWSLDSHSKLITRRWRSLTSAHRDRRDYPGTGAQVLLFCHTAPELFYPIFLSVGLNVLRLLGTGTHVLLLCHTAPRLCCPIFLSVGLNVPVPLGTGAQVLLFCHTATELYYPVFLRGLMSSDI